MFRLTVPLPVFPFRLLRIPSDPDAAVVLHCSSAGFLYRNLNCRLLGSGIAVLRLPSCSALPSSCSLDHFDVTCIPNDSLMGYPACFDNQKQRSYEKEEGMCCNCCADRVYYSLTGEQRMSILTLVIRISTKRGCT